MSGNVTALEGSHVTGKYRDEKHAAHMHQACGLGSSQAKRDSAGDTVPCRTRHSPSSSDPC